MEEIPEKFSHYDDPNLAGIDEKPEAPYQELMVNIPPFSSKFSRPTERIGEPEPDYHDSVEFDDIAIQHHNRTNPVTINVAPAQQTSTKLCNLKKIILVILGIVLFVIMIAIIGVLASHLVTDNDKQLKKLIALERSLSDEIKNNNLQNTRQEKKLGSIEKEMNYMLKDVFNHSDPVKIARLTRNTSVVQRELEKLQKVISEIYCGSCQRKISKKLIQGYVCDCQGLKTMRDCLDYYQNGVRVNGIYKVHQLHRKVISVYCDQTKDGGGWTVFQRRRDGSVAFNRSWTKYVDGFGDLENEHWLGNQNIFTMTLQSDTEGNELRVELEDWEGVTKYAAYSSFKIDNADTYFKLHVSGYTGNAGDSLSVSNDMAFSTKDKDNDIYDNAHCGDYHKAGWWYKRCGYANLNGKYHYKSDTTDGIYWKGFKGMGYSLKYCAMKVRRKV